MTGNVSTYHITTITTQAPKLSVRYRQISTFGRGTIRRFATNASEMKKLAARDFEDLLQVGFQSKGKVPTNPWC